MDRIVVAVEGCISEQRRQAGEMQQSRCDGNCASASSPCFAVSVRPPAPRAAVSLAFVPRLRIACFVWLAAVAVAGSEREAESNEGACRSHRGDATESSEQSRSHLPTHHRPSHQHVSLLTVGWFRLELRRRTGCAARLSAASRSRRVGAVRRPPAAGNGSQRHVVRHTTHKQRRRREVGVSECVEGVGERSRRVAFVT